MCRTAAGDLVDLPNDGEELTVRFGENGREQGVHRRSSKGMFDASYTPQAAGACAVWVQFRERHIKGSPFNVMVEAGEPLLLVCWFAGMRAVCW